MKVQTIRVFKSDVEDIMNRLEERTRLLDLCEKLLKSYGFPTMIPLAAAIEKELALTAGYQGEFCEKCGSELVQDPRYDKPFCPSWLSMEGGCGEAPRWIGNE